METKCLKGTPALLSITTNRSRTPDRTHPVDHHASTIWWGITPPRLPKKQKPVSFYFGDIVGVRTPQGFGGCASRRRLRKRNSYQKHLRLLPITTNRSRIPDRTHPVCHHTPPKLQCANYSTSLKCPLRKIYCARYVFLKIGRNTISVLCGSVSYIACFTLLRRCHHVSNYSTSENGFRGRAHRQTLFHHPLFGRSRTTGAPQDALRKIGRNTPSGALLEI